MTQVSEGGIRERRLLEDATTIRLSAVSLGLGVVLPLIATAIHPHRENVMDNPAVFAEYAASQSWVVVHFAQWFAAMLLFVGLLGVYHAIRAASSLARAFARFGLFAVVQAAAAITGLQVVDGVALKWATESWIRAEGQDKAAAFAAAEAVRFTEYGGQSYSRTLLSLARVLLGLATVVGDSYPRWLGVLAATSGVAWIVHGVMVPYVGFFDSNPRLVAMALVVVWGFSMAFHMWRRAGSHATDAGTTRTRHPLPL